MSDSADKAAADKAAADKAAADKAAADKLAKDQKESQKTHDKRIRSVKKGGVKVEFTKSPTGLFGLAYNPGEKASFSKDQAAILIDAGVAKKA